MSGSKSVLIVDDETYILKLLFEIFSKRLGYEAETAGTAEEAINKLSHRAYDVIILDIRMPKFSGKDLFKILGTIDEDFPKRVIFCTGDLLSPETRAFLDQNTNLSLTKPFSLHDVKSVLDEFFKRRHQT